MNLRQPTIVSERDICPCRIRPRSYMLSGKQGRRTSVQMPRMCRFTGPDTKEPVFVNPSIVRFARQSGSGTVIFFAGDHAITVLEDVESVVKVMEDTP